jgi:hypothetical protein
MANNTITLAEPAKMSDMKEQANAAGNIFDEIPREPTMIDGFDMKLRPTICDPVTGNVDFVLEQDSVHYISPQIDLYCKFKVTNGGVDLKSTDEVALTNLFGSTFFQSCTMFANDLRITENNSECLHYKNYVEAICSSSADHRMSEMQNRIFYKDTEGQFETMGSANSANKGYVSRKELIAKSKPCEFVCPVGLDLLSTDRLLPTRLKLGWQFARAPAAFYLMAPEPTGTTIMPDYRAEIIECYLMIRKIRLVESVVKEHQRMFAAGYVAQYPFVRTVLKKKAMSKSDMTCDWHSTFTGKLPQIIVVYMVETAAETGTFWKNPYNFQHFGLTHAEANIDGHQYPGGGYIADFTAGKEVYLELVDGLYKNVAAKVDGGIIVNRGNYHKGYALITWNFNPDKTNSIFDRDGAVNINLQFKAALDAGVTIVATGYFEEVMQMNEWRHVKATTRDRSN